MVERPDRTNIRNIWHEGVLNRNRTSESGRKVGEDWRASNTVHSLEFTRTLAIVNLRRRDQIGRNQIGKDERKEVQQHR